VIDGQGLYIHTPNSAQQPPRVHTTMRCADAVEWGES